MNHLRRLAALALLVLLAAGGAAPVAAGEALPPAASGAPQAAQQDTVSSWPELRAWLDAHKTVGGAVRLAADIHIQDSYDYVGRTPLFRLKAVTVDCGEHTIFVEAGGYVTLSYANYTLTLRGEGGPQGLLCVLPGGRLGVDMLELDARSGSAVTQREGGVLTVDPDHPPRLPGAGGIAYAQQPVLLPPDTPSLPCYAAPESAGGPAGAAAALPGTFPLQINWQGRFTDTPAQPVVWDVEAVRTELEARRRTVITGRWSGPLAAAGFEHLQPGDCTLFSLPQATLVFPVDGAALLEVTFRTEEGLVRIASLDFMAAPGLLTSQVLVSTDSGAAWSPVDEPALEETSEDGVYGATVFPDTPQDGSWFLVELTYPGGRILHTDVVACEGAAARPIDYEDGHRGGGEPLTPAASPPAVSPPDAGPPAGGAGPASPSPLPASETPAPAGPGSVPALPPGSGQTAQPAGSTANSTIVPHSQPAVQSRAHDSAGAGEPSAASSPQSAAPAGGPAPAAPGGALPPAAQVALGAAAMAALAAAALFLLNPQLLRKLLPWKKGGKG